MLVANEQKGLLGELMAMLGESLDITESEFDVAVKSYEAVGSWLSRGESLLAPYKPVIKPQGSFLIGTMTRPVNGKDELDIDLVCQLTGKRAGWSQYQLKQIVGDQLKNHATYRKMLKSPDGRRCWTLPFDNMIRYHMDILPAIISHGFFLLREKSLSSIETTDFENLAISITDRLRQDYYTSTDSGLWLKSNPEGYAKWFFQRAVSSADRLFSLKDAIKPVPQYQRRKLPLQVVVQLFKRHRDMMFNGDDDKPISIIITTLAAKIYNKEQNIFEALMKIAFAMADNIEERYDSESGKTVKWVGNPVNNQENFADKWRNEPKKAENFYSWLHKLQWDLRNLSQEKQGLNFVRENMITSFGRSEVDKTFSAYGDKQFDLRNVGQQFMQAGSGILGSAGIPVKNHNFHGNGQ